MKHAILPLSRAVPSALLGFFLVAGCGGGNDEPGSTVAPLVSESRYITVETGSIADETNRLSGIQVETVFGPANAQRLTTRWNPNQKEQLYPRFQVQVTRFFDADGTTAKAIAEPLVAVPFEKRTNGFLESPERVLEKGWDFRKSDGDTAPLFVPGGVYIIDIRTPEGGKINERLQTRLFIAPGSARSNTGDDENGVSIETKEVERQNGLAALSVVPSGNVYVPRTSDISLSFEPGFGTPPKNWTVFLRRYKEARDGRPFSEAAQPITVEEVSPTRWRAFRPNDELLDPYAVYVVEVRRAGSDSRSRHLFITGGE